MEIISRPRMGGKTIAAVEWVQADPDRVLLVMDHAERRRLMNVYGLPERQILVAQGADRHLTGRRNAHLAVDNIDYLGWRTVLELGGMLAHRIEMVTETRP